MKAKLARAQKCELISNIVLGVWAVVTCICFIVDVVKLPAVMIALGIPLLLIVAVDGYFIGAVFYYKRKIRIQNRKDGVVAGKDPL